MKQPMFAAALLVLAGTLDGLAETPPGIRLLGTLGAAGYWIIIWRGRESRPGTLPFSFVQAAALMLGAALFVIGFCRALFVSHVFHTAESLDFFRPFQATNPGQFDYASYLRALGIHTKAQYEIYRGEADAELPPLFAAIDGLRAFLKMILEANLEERDAGILEAVLLGAKENLPSDVQSLYQRAGISHLLAVSGLHVSLIGMGLYQLLRRMKMTGKTAGRTAALFTILYVLLTGASGSGLRAGIMLCLSFLSLEMYRKYDLHSSLCAALILSLLYRPYQVFQSGFQLSFAAVGAISLGAARFSLLLERNLRAASCRVDSTHIRNLKIHKDIPDNIGLEKTGSDSTDRDKKRVESICMDNLMGKRIPAAFRLSSWKITLITGATIQLLTLPILCWHYYVISPYGILLNLIVIPLMPAAVISGGLSMGAGIGSYAFKNMAMYNAAINPAFVIDRIPRLFAAPAHYVLALYQKLAAYSLRLPGAMITIGRPGLWQIFLYYLALGLWTFFCLGFRERSLFTAAMRRFQKCPLRIRFGIYLTGLLICCRILLPVPVKGIRVTMIDVGQGDGFLIETKECRVLMDGGSSSNEKLGPNILEPLLLSKGIDRLDMAFVSHADLDHVSGIEYLLSEDSRIRVDELILPAAAKEHEKYDKLKELFQNRLRYQDRFQYQNRFLSEGLYRYQNQYHYLQEGDVFRLGEMETDAAQEISRLKKQKPTASLRCIYEGNSTDPSDINRHSPGILLSCGDFTMLFTGDMPLEEEGNLCEKFDQYTGGRHLSVLKAGHHGSAGSTGEMLLSKTQPKIAWISAGRKNRYHHPAGETLERLQEAGTDLYVTAWSGAVELRVYQEKMTMHSYFSTVEPQK